MKTELQIKLFNWLEGSNNNRQKETTNMKVFQYVITTVDEDGELLKVVDTGNAVKMAAEDVIAEILIERGKDLSKQYGPYDEDDGWEILVRPFV